MLKERPPIKFQFSALGVRQRAGRESGEGPGPEILAKIGMAQESVGEYPKL
jgi:hypothetical protein